MATCYLGHLRLNTLAKKVHPTSFDARQKSVFETLTYGLYLLVIPMFFFIKKMVGLSHFTYISKNARSTNGRMTIAHTLYYSTVSVTSQLRRRSFSNIHSVIFEIHRVIFEIQPIIHRLTLKI